MQHHFNVEIAKIFGVNVAIFLDHMAFWITKNMANNRHYHEGTYWTYNTIEAYKELFPYWTTRQMRGVIDKCIKYGLILESNYNITTYDRTKWYALTEESAKLLNISICQKGQMDSSKLTNGFVKKGKPIPYALPVTNTSREEERKKRVPLSENFKPDQKREEKAKEVSQRCNISFNDLLYKFITMYKGKYNKCATWQEDFELFLLREKPEIKNQISESKHNQEIRSTVPEHKPGEHAFTDYAKPETVNKHMDAIKKLLSRKVINGSKPTGKEERQG